MAIRKVLITNIFEPLDPKNRLIADFPWEAKSLVSYVPPGGEYIVNLNGVNVTDYSVIPHENSQIIIAPMLEGSDSSKSIIRIVAIIAIAVVAPYAAGAIMGATAGMVGAGVYGGMMGAGIFLGLQIGVVVAGSMIINALLPPQMPDVPQIAGADAAASPTYSWEGMRTLARIGTPIPVLYGTHAVAGNIISRRVEYDGSDEYLYVLLALSEGRIQNISDSNIKLNGMDITTYKDYEMFQRDGSDNQSIIPYFGETITANGFSAQCLYNDPVVKQSLGNGIEGMILYMAFPYGIYYANDDGGFDTRSVNFTVEYRKVGDGTWINVPDDRNVAIDYYEYKYVKCSDVYEEGWTQVEDLYSTYCSLDNFDTDYVMSGERRAIYETTLPTTWTVKGAQNTPLKFTIRIDGLLPDQYETRITRNTADDSNTRTKTELFHAGIGEVIYDELCYPGLALLGLKILATGQLSGGDPTITTTITRAPHIIHDEDGMVYTDYGDMGNPAWAAWDLLTNVKYGAGLAFSKIDFQSFVDWADFCDEIVYNGLSGGGERRARFNGIFDFNTNVWEALEKLATVGRAGIVIRGTKYSVVVDKPETPVQLFSMGNIIEKSFKTAYVGSEDLATEIEIQYTNANNDYTKDQLSVVAPDYYDNTVTTKKSTISLLGVTNPSAAYRAGKYFLHCNKQLRRSVEFEVGVDALACTVGDVIYFAHDVPMWAYSGRVVSATSTSVTLDQEVTVTEGKSYAIIIRISTDDTFEERVIDFVITQTTNTLNVTEAFTTIPSEYDVFTFGETGSEKQLFRIFDISRASDQTRKVKAIDYNESILTDTEVIIPTPSASYFDSNISVENLDYEEHLEKKNDGTIIPYIDLFWDLSVDYNTSARFNVLISSDGGYSYAPIVTTTNLNYTYNALDLTEGKSYIFKVQVEFFGTVEPLLSAPEVSVIYLGKLEAPEDVTGFTATLDTSQSVVRLTWDPVSDVDLASYYLTVDTTTLVEKFSGTSYSAPLPAPDENHTYGISAVDTSGNLSETEATTELEIVSPPQLDLSSEIIGTELYLSWTVPTSDLQIDYYLVTYDSTEVRVKTTTFIKLINWSGGKTFYVSPVDIIGNVGTAASLNITINLSSLSALTGDVIDNNVLLKWIPVEGTLPITNFEIRRGDVYATATIIGEKKGTFTSIFETLAGSYTYWCVPIDSAGNYGTPRSILAEVSSPPDYQLHLDYYSDFSGTLVNGITSEDVMLYGVNATETYSVHFTSNSFASPNAQVVAGYPLWISPFETSGSYEETLDYGTLLAGTLISVVPTWIIGGDENVTVVMNIKTSDDNIDWDDWGNVYTAYALNFRYVKITVSFVCDDTSYIEVQDIQIKLASKILSESGSVEALSTDSGGTTVTFATDFVDVTSIGVSVNGTVPLTVIYDFDDVPNPTDFDVYVFDDVGDRASATVSWTATGY